MIRELQDTYPHTYRCFAAHLQANRWVARYPDNPRLISYLQVVPEAWMPIPGVSLNPHKPISPGPPLLRISPDFAQKLAHAAAQARRRFHVERWVKIMPIDPDCAIWDQHGHTFSAEDLPIPGRLQLRINTWAESCEPDVLEGGTFIFPGDIQQFSELGLLLAQSVKQSLPDWTVLYHHLANALRPESREDDYVITL